MAKISVIIPTYNREKYVGEAIRSVVSQLTADEVEVIVVDDGSTDNTADALRPYMQRIKYCRQDNRGVSAARNRGVAESTGDFVAFLDSDDVWCSSGRLAMQVPHLRPGVICFGKVEWFTDGDPGHTTSDSALLGGGRLPNVNADGVIPDPVMDVAEGRHLHLNALLCRKEDFLRIGLFDTQLTMGEDEDWFGRAATMNFAFHYATQPLARIRLHTEQTDKFSEESLRSLISVFETMAERIGRSHPQARKAVRRRLAAKWSHLANVLRTENRRSEALEAAWRAYQVNPLEFQRLLKAIYFLK